MDGWECTHVHIVPLSTLFHYLFLLSILFFFLIRVVFLVQARTLNLLYLKQITKKFPKQHVRKRLKSFFFLSKVTKSTSVKLS